MTESGNPPCGKALLSFLVCTIEEINRSNQHQCSESKQEVWASKRDGPIRESNDSSMASASGFHCLHILGLFLFSCIDAYTALEKYTEPYILSLKQ